MLGKQFFTCLGHFQDFFFKVLDLFIFLFCVMNILPVSVMGTTCMLCVPRIRRQCQIPWNLSYRWLWAAEWVLGTEPGPLQEQTGSHVLANELSPQPEAVQSHPEWCSCLHSHSRKARVGRVSSHLCKPNTGATVTNKEESHRCPSCKWKHHHRVHHSSAPINYVLRCNYVVLLLTQGPHHFYYKRGCHYVSI